MKPSSVVATLLAVQPQSSTDAPHSTTIATAITLGQAAHQEQLHLRPRGAAVFLLGAAPSYEAASFVAQWGLLFSASALELVLGVASYVKDQREDETLRLLRVKQQNSLVIARAMITYSHDVDDAVLDEESQQDQVEKVAGVEGRKSAAQPASTQALQDQLHRLGAALAPREWKQKNLPRLRNEWIAQLALLEIVDQMLHIRQQQIGIERELQNLHEERSVQESAPGKVPQNLTESLQMRLRDNRYRYDHNLMLLRKREEERMQAYQRLRAEQLDSENKKEASRAQEFEIQKEAKEAEAEEQRHATLQQERSEAIQRLKIEQEQLRVTLRKLERLTGIVKVVFNIDPQFQLGIIPLNIPTEQLEKLSSKAQVELHYKAIYEQQHVTEELDRLEAEWAQAEKHRKTKSRTPPTPQVITRT